MAAAAETLKLKDRYSGGSVWLTLRDGKVVGAMGSDPKRYVGLTLAQAKHHARYGGTPLYMTVKSPAELDRDIAEVLAGRAHGRSHSTIAKKGRRSHSTARHDVRCECGEWAGERCAWTGPKADTVRVEYMPESFRAEHRNARNVGIYPHNGAVRLRVSPACADHMVATDSEWVSKL